MGLAKDRRAGGLWVTSGLCPLHGASPPCLSAGEHSHTLPPNQPWTPALQGAPYGYTPFCNDEAAMEGFRFWKQGFWRDHLQGKPYHISALYVIDLDRFRYRTGNCQGLLQNGCCTGYCAGCWGWGEL